MKQIQYSWMKFFLSTLQILSNKEKEVEGGVHGTGVGCKGNSWVTRSWIRADTKIHWKPNPCSCVLSAGLCLCCSQTVVIHKEEGWTTQNSWRSVDSGSLQRHRQSWSLLPTPTLSHTVCNTEVVQVRHWGTVTAFPNHMGSLLYCSINPGSPSA